MNDRSLPWVGPGSVGVLEKTVPAQPGRPFWESATPARQAVQHVLGVIDERSTQHIAGWMRDPANPAERIDYEVVVDAPEGGRVLMRGRADRLNKGLRDSGAGDGRYGFYDILPATLSARDTQFLCVRPLTTGESLPLSPVLRTAFEPINFVALDIVDNCNLRCPFCVYDYTNVRVTNMMTEAVFQKALRLLPYVTDGNFWLSCLHEATLHPRLTDFIGMVPREWRSKLFFTTNLAKRMPAAYFAMLADSGIYKINISLESFDPAVYERMRKGARHRIFMENWAALLAAFETGRATPRLRYNMMAYKSNLREIPGMVKILLEEKRAWQVEIRDTFRMPHIPEDFGEAEYLSAEDWSWLYAQLAGYDPEQVMVFGPQPAPDTATPDAADAPTGQMEAIPGAVKPAAARKEEVDLELQAPFNLSVTWEGKMIVSAPLPMKDGRPLNKDYVTVNVATLRDPRLFLASL